MLPSLVKIPCVKVLHFSSPHPLTNEVQWSTGAHTSDIEVSPVMDATYYLIETLGKCSDTTYHDIHVIEAIDLGLDKSAIIAPGDSLSIELDGAQNYLWTPKENISCDSCSYTIVFPKTTTTYCVQAFQNGCTISACIEVIINDECTVVLPNIIYPGGSGQKCKMVCKSGRLCDFLYCLHIRQMGQPALG